MQDFIEEHEKRVKKAEEKISRAYAAKHKEVEAILSFVPVEKSAEVAGHIRSLFATAYNIGGAEIMIEILLCSQEKP